jgi:hypothetical protein
MHRAIAQRRAIERIVGDEQRAIEVRPIDERRELRRRGNRARGLGHAAEHDLQPERTGQGDHPPRFAQAGALHQLDVDPVEHAARRQDVGEALHALIRDQRQRTALPQPGGVFNLLPAERLLDEDHASPREPFDAAQGVVAFAPALVGVDDDRRVGDVPDRVDHRPIGGELAAELHLQEAVAGGLARLRAHDLGGVEPDGERGRRRAPRVQTPDTVPRRAEFFSDPVVQREIDGGLGGGVAGRKRIDGGQDLLAGKRVPHRRDQRRRAVQERRRGLLGFPR